MSSATHEDESEDPRDYTKYIAILKAGTIHHQELTAGWMLPGRGASRESCGRGFFIRGCTGPKSIITNADKKQELAHVSAGKDIVQRRIMTCHQISCLKCLENTISRSTSKICDRMFAFNISLMSDLFEHHKKSIFNHFLVSIPKEEYEAYKDDVYRGKKERMIRKRLKILGFRGGCEIYHPYRFSKGLKKYYWSPHYHFILSGWIKPNDVILHHKETGMIFRSLSTVTDRGALHATVRYLLTHCGIKRMEKRVTDMVKYTGLAQNRYFKSSILLGKSSTYHDEVSDIIHDIGSADKLNKHDKRHKFISAKYQIYATPGGKNDISEYTLQSEGLIVGPYGIRKIMDMCKQKDNPAIPTSAASTSNTSVKGISYMDWNEYLKQLEHMHIDNITPIGYDTAADPHQYIVMRVTYSQTLPNSVKCDIVKYLIWYIDPGTHTLCGVCSRPMHRLTPLTTSPDPKIIKVRVHDIPDGPKLGIDRGNFRAYDFIFDAVEGMPYYINADDDTHRELGRLLANEYDNIAPVDLQVLSTIQSYDAEIKARVYEYRIKTHTTLRNNEIKDIILEQYKKEKQSAMSSFV